MMPITYEFEYKNLIYTVNVKRFGYYDWKYPPNSVDTSWELLKCVNDEDVEVEVSERDLDKDREFMQALEYNAPMLD